MKNHSYTLGIAEEFAIVDPPTAAVAKAALV